MTTVSARTSASTACKQGRGGRSWRDAHQHTGPVTTLRDFVDQVPVSSGSTAALAVKKRKLKRNNATTMFDVVMTDPRCHRRDGQGLYCRKGGNRLDCVCRNLSHAHRRETMPRRAGDQQCLKSLRGNWNLNRDICWFRTAVTSCLSDKIAIPKFPRSPRCRVSSGDRLRHASLSISLIWDTAHIPATMAALQTAKKDLRRKIRKILLDVPKESIISQCQAVYTS